MKFRSGSLEFNASVVESTQAPSPRTGNPLASMTIQFRAQKQPMHEQALEQAEQRQTGGLFSIGDGDLPDGEWRVSESTSSYVGTEPWGINHHVWRIEQVERLACELLIVGGVRLVPYDYTEEVIATPVSGIRLAARAIVSPADLETISRLGGGLEVVRQGISDTPRRMRLTGYVWGETVEGLALVVACEDERRPRVTLAGFDGPSATDEDLTDLVELLPIDAEVLRLRRHARRQVADPDAWQL